MDEQETGRDRSVSPNYHSLIYGDTKKKSEGKTCLPMFFIQVTNMYLFKPQILIFSIGFFNLNWIRS